jgi:hypothetical protein
MVRLLEKLLDLALKECPIAGFIARKECNDFFDFGGAVISGKMDHAMFGFDAVKLTFDIVIIEVIGNILAGKDVKGSRLPRAWHQGG